MNIEKKTSSELIKFFKKTKNEMALQCQQMPKLTKKKMDCLIEDHLLFLNKVENLSGTWQTISIGFGLYTAMFSFEEELDQKILKLQANFSNTNISDLDFKNLNLPNTQWIGCWADHVNFYNSVLARSCLISSNLESAVFKKADLQKCDFSRSYLVGADFEGANLEGADFENCDLSGANFINAKITNANFKGAKLDGVIGLTSTKVL